MLGKSKKKKPEAPKAEVKAPEEKPAKIAAKVSSDYTPNNCKY